MISTESAIENMTLSHHGGHIRGEGADRCGVTVATLIRATGAVHETPEGKR